MCEYETRNQVADPGPLRAAELQKYCYYYHSSDKFEELQYELT